MLRLQHHDSEVIPHPRPLQLLPSFPDAPDGEGEAIPMPSHQPSHQTRKGGKPAAASFDREKRSASFMALAADAAATAGSTDDSFFESLANARQRAPHHTTVCGDGTGAGAAAERCLDDLDLSWSPIAGTGGAGVAPAGPGGRAHDITAGQPDSAARGDSESQRTAARSVALHAKPRMALVSLLYDDDGNDDEAAGRVGGSTAVRGSGSQGKLAAPAESGPFEANFDPFDLHDSLAAMEASWGASQAGGGATALPELGAAAAAAAATGTDAEGPLATPPAGTTMVVEAPQAGGSELLMLPLV